MNCMRCGEEIAPGQVFCEECLLTMEKYPVNPTTPVHLPRQRTSAPVKKPVKKRTVSAEDQVRGLKKRLRIAIVWCVISTLLAAALCVPALKHMMEEDFKLGQNYSSFHVTEPSNEEGEGN